MNKNNIIVLQTYPHLKPNMNYETNLKQGVSNEFQGKYGGFRPGVNIRLGGTANNAIVIEKTISPGTILNTYKNLLPTLKYEQKYKKNCVCERVGNVGGMEYNPKKYINSFVDLTTLDPGTVLNTYTNLTPDHRFELKTNTIGGRSNEAYAYKAGFYNRFL